ncbi:MAG: ACT domain-containing protein [Clostridia bacterium]|nr:ACT domain-containing protein [Clostridia bacterium]
MAVKQLSVFIENRRGMLVEVTEALASAKIDIRALALAETPDYGILRLIVSDTDKALEVIRATGRTVSVNNMLGVRISDRPGGLAEALKILTDNGIDVDYMYAFIAETGDQANVVLRVADTKKAERTLSDTGFDLIN